MKFRYNQKVRITKGFYKTFKGTIKDYQEPRKENEKTKYNVNVEIDNDKIKTIIGIKEDEMKPVSIFSFY